ncbi:MAG: OOP family OmpA-OmpF porin [Paraglaciecola sp.]|jgi:OOP family OmpA-OmpF porin
MKHINNLRQKVLSKSLVLLLWLLSLPFIGQSQSDLITKPSIQNYPTWEAGAFFGIGLIYGDLTGDVSVTAGSSQPAYGISVFRNLNSNWAIRANIFHTKLKANDLDSELESHRNRGFSHETPLTEVSILAQWDLRGKRRYKRVASFKKTVSPYFFAGIAGGIGKSETFYDSQKDNPLIEEDKENLSNFRIGIPLGGGIKVDLSQRSFVGFEFGFRPTFGDLLDGVSASGNADKNDWYAFGGLSIGYRFTSDDADGDGVVDVKDRCPGVPGERQFQGCPDSDGDGVQDKDDNCPLIAGAKTLNGCLDSDLDGVADTEDNCPNTKGMRRLQGCPDADWDNVIDKNDACPNTPGLAKFKGCPDTDLDGVMDLEDRCPEITGLLKFRGCPEGEEIEVVIEEVIVEDAEVETGTETVPDFREKEKIITEIEPIKVKESVIEELQNSVLEMDKTEKIIAEVVIEKEVRAVEETPVLKEEKIAAIPTVLSPTFEMMRFATSSNELSANDKRNLDKVAAQFSNLSDYNLIILGYTDTVGNDYLNQQLSEKRAKACFDYLAKKSIDVNRMTYTGLGETNPISRNDTAAGRAENRRVEIILNKKIY